MWGFSSLRGILDVIATPLVLAALLLAWSAIQAWYELRTLQKLILRELKESTPFPEEKCTLLQEC